MNDFSLTIPREQLKDLLREVLPELLAEGTAAEAADAISEQEFAARYGVATSTQRAWRRKGRLRYVRIGRRAYYRPEHVAEFLSARERRRA